MSCWRSLCTFVNRLIKKNVLEKELNNTIYSLLEDTFEWPEKVSIPPTSDQ